ncbi:MAG TPA: ABC transporter permease [Candidatus Dormibacteraeota bacterium]|nr:ABC transporter permease [Candidatus Dormibacteraeota bacterium]HEX2681882.1 ABC transporter permease [Candidatus Dormibacteraeota bacterium]
MSAVAAIRAQTAGSARRQAWVERFKLALRTPSLLVGLGVILFWILCAIFAARIAPYDPLQPDILHKLQPPSVLHRFGTDGLGRDVLSRVIFGSRGILVAAPLATLLGTVVGTAIGLVAGYFRGIVEEVLMRITDAFLALPTIVTALLVLAAVGGSTTTVIFVIGLGFAPIIARTVRAAVLSEAQLEYVEAARLRQERAPYVMFVEILPNVMGPVLVEFTVRLGYAVFAIATLSFLGFGIPPPNPDWGLSIAEQYTYLIANLWWPVLFPALAIASVVIAVNLFADGLARVLER